MSASEASGNGASAPRLLISDSRCKVCKSDHRGAIDAMLRDGRSQASVRRHFNGVLGDEFFTANNLSVHTRKHLYGPEPEEWILKSARARKMLGDPNALPPQQPTPEDALRTVVEVGLKMIDAGVSVPETTDVIRAAKELKRMESEGLPATEAQMLRELQAFTKAVKKHLPEEKWEAMYKDYEAIISSM